jgi:hypothetical protein
MSDLAHLKIWDDPAIRDSLSWYLDVAENRRPAKFRIAATLATQIDPAAASGEPRFELLAMGAVVDPLARGHDPFAGGNGSSIVTVSARPRPQDAEAIFSVVVGYSPDETCQHFPGVRLRSQVIAFQDSPKIRWRLPFGSRWAVEKARQVPGVDDYDTHDC